MGASNVDAAFVLGNSLKLSHSAKIVLLRMANTSLDKDKPPRYFAGWELLALALGYDVPPKTDSSEAARKVREGIRRNVRRATRELEDAGLITSPWGVDTRARIGRKAEYHLHLDVFGRVTSPTTLPGNEGDAPDHPEGDASDHPGGWSEVVGEGDASDLPKENEEPGSGARSGTIPSLGGNVTSAHEPQTTTDDEYAAARKYLIPRGPEIYAHITAAMQTHNLEHRDAVIYVARTLRKKGNAA